MSALGLDEGASFLGHPATEPAQRWIVIVDLAGSETAFVGGVSVHGVALAWDRDGAMRFDSKDAAVAAAKRVEHVTSVVRDER